MWRRRRFPGAGASAEREFYRQLRVNARQDVGRWATLVALAAALFAWSLLADGVGARVVASAAGGLIGLMCTIISLGGHISAFRWWLGAEGERLTARQLEGLPKEWHCEHDLENDQGNWDHVLVGPPGVFLVDSKLVHGTAAAGGDGLRAGRLGFRGGNLRFDAMSVHDELARRLGSSPPWVQAVVAVWADFPQGHHEEEHVVYVQGDKLLEWLTSLPLRVNAPQRAALVTALRELRSSSHPSRPRATTSGAEGWRGLGIRRWRLTPMRTPQQPRRAGRAR
jgi:hypothetical protein